MAHSMTLFAPPAEDSLVREKINLIHNIADAYNEQKNYRIENKIRIYFANLNISIPTSIQSSLEKILLAKANSDISYYRLHARVDFLLYLIAQPPSTSWVDAKASEILSSLHIGKGQRNEHLESLIIRYFSNVSVPLSLHKLIAEIKRKAASSKIKHLRRHQLAINFIDSQIEMKSIACNPRLKKEEEMSFEIIDIIEDLNIIKEGARQFAESQTQLLQVVQNLISANQQLQIRLACQNDEIVNLKFKISNSLFVSDHQASPQLHVPMHLETFQPEEKPNSIATMSINEDDDDVIQIQDSIKDLRACGAALSKNFQFTSALVMQLNVAHERLIIMERCNDEKIALLKSELLILEQKKSIQVTETMFVNSFLTSDVVSLPSLFTQSPLSGVPTENTNKSEIPSRSI